MLQKIEEYLQDTYAKTGWPFFDVAGLRSMYGDGLSDVLNELREQGKIRRRESVNGYLVQLLIDKNGNEIKEP